MRLIVYGSFLILCCSLVHSSLADDKYYKKNKDNDEYRGEKKYKNKYRTYYSDDNLEEYEVRKYNGKKNKQDLDYTKENKKYKNNKFVESEESPLEFKKNKKKNEGKREKIFIPEDDVVEFLAEAKQKFSKDGKGDAKVIRKKNGDSSAEKSSKNKKYKEKKVVEEEEDEDDDDDDDSEEEISKMKKESEEEEDEKPPKKFRKKIRVRIPDSPEDDSDESDEDDHRRTCKVKGGRKSCWSDDGSHETSDKPTKKKIKYSIKFAHEKEKSVPTESDNIMMKIHRSDKKKYKYEQEDVDDSSEEHTHPKRLHFLDDDED